MIQGRGRVYQCKFYTGRRASHDAVSYCTLGSHVVCLSCAVSANACSDAQDRLSHVGDVAEDGQVVGVEEQTEYRWKPVSQRVRGGSECVTWLKVLSPCTAHNCSPL